MSKTGLLIKPLLLNKAEVVTLNDDEPQSIFGKYFLAEIHIYDKKKYQVWYNENNSIMDVSCFCLLKECVLTFGDILVLGENGESLDKADLDYLFDACFQVDNARNEKRFALEIFSFFNIDKKPLNDYISMIYRRLYIK